jgi:hypothetical protein
LTQRGYGYADAAIWNLWRVGSRPRGRVAAIWSGVQALAAAVVLDVMLTFHLISFGTNF